MRQVARWLERGLEWFLILQMALLTAVVVYAVIMRKAGVSASWYDEVAAIQLAWITYYGAGLAALKRRHIGFDGVLLAMGPALRRPAVFLAEGLTLGFFALMTWSGLEVLAVLEGMSLISLTWVPVQFTQSVIPIGGALFIGASLLSFPDYLRATMAGVSMEHAEIEEAVR
ncbi:TRAP transporter small permease [Rubrimonas cliftonensis]|uniref:TRAP transporter small permease protein n=1 Tax=Rubrimonas cliftonensis TaxID=89524 RepID=A0A1H4AK85_9RHOB|nr:TRAP transporter small permease subunit [Rubrimonas cliftonensis]SEA36062.1 TRAP-type C4-dicarboxylate transport system, small permease component [Rubrimonas cliftonensis]